MKGLVLEGGGAKGAFHCGAVKALYDNGYSFDGVAGTSIGAINGALIVQDCGYETLYKMWTEIKPSDITDLDNLEVTKLFNKEFSGKTFKYWAKQAIKTINNLGVPTEKTLAYLQQYIDEEKIRKSKMDYAIVTYCLSTRKPLELLKEDIPEGKMLNYIFASAYYPAFKLDRLDGKFFIDGGVYNNLPLNILPSHNHYDEIFAIRTMSKMPHKTIENDSVTVHYICPSEDLGSTVNINRKNINDKLKLGYYDTLRFIKRYIGNKFYIDGTIDLFDRIIRNMTDDQRAVYFSINQFEANEIYQKRQNISSAAFDSKTFIFWDTIAKSCGIEKYKIYRPKEFLNTILQNDAAITDQNHKQPKKMKEYIQLYTQIRENVKEVLK